MNTNKQEENFSEDPVENLRIENEILKLKMQAESGAFFGESEEELSPEIENIFLQQVQAFEDAWQDARQVMVYDFLDKPLYKMEKDINDIEVSEELKKLLVLFKKHDMVLSVLGEYEPRIIYRFITEELFNLETDDIRIPGFTKHFIYEEFHPNHKMDINERAEAFLEHWFERKFNEYCAELGDPVILNDGSMISNEGFLKKINQVFESYLSFTNCQYEITEISFQWNGEEERGIGHAEGSVQYDAQMENGEQVRIEGPFKLYMSNEYGGWDIFNFVFPGFVW